ncbi:MAG: hypothetical protein WCT14_12985, partial [Treponemataceae bacterium]
MEHRIVNGFTWLAILLALSAAPLALAIPFLAHKRPDFGMGRFLLAIIAGIVAVIPAALIQVVVPRFSEGAFNLLAHAFLVIAVTEETA